MFAIQDKNTGRYITRSIPGGWMAIYRNKKEETILNPDKLRAKTFQLKKVAENYLRRELNKRSQDYMIQRGQTLLEQPDTPFKSHEWARHIIARAEALNKCSFEVVEITS